MAFSLDSLHLTLPRRRAVVLDATDDPADLRMLTAAAAEAWSALAGAIFRHRHAWPGVCFVGAAQGGGAVYTHTMERER